MYRPRGWSLYDRRWAFPEGSNDEDIQVKYWSNAVLLLPANKSQYPRPLLASASMLGWILLSLVQCFALCSQVPDTITIMTHHAPNHHFLHTKCVWYWCLRSWAWTQKCIFCSFIWPSRWKFALSSKKSLSPRNQDGFCFTHWWFAQTHISQLASVWSCQICILYRNRWRSWCIIRILEHLERSVSNIS